MQPVLGLAFADAVPDLGTAVKDETNVTEVTDLVVISAYLQVGLLFCFAKRTKSCYVVQGWYLRASDSLTWVLLCSWATTQCSMHAS